MFRSLRIPLACAGAFAAVALSLPSFAQTPEAPKPAPPGAAHGTWGNSTPEERARQLTDLMKEKLGLTVEQIPKVDAINLDTASKMQAAFQGAGTRSTKMNAVKKIQDDKQAALKQVLTAEQFQKYEAAREEFKQKIEAHARAKAAGNTP